SPYRSDAMTNEDRLNRLAERYRSLGFQVVLRPGPDDLPPFAKDFKVEMVATKPDGDALVVAKKSPSELQLDQNVRRYSEITSQNPGWRLDLYVLGPEEQPVANRHEVRELDEPDIRRRLEDV